MNCRMLSTGSEDDESYLAWAKAAEAQLLPLSETRMTYISPIPVCFRLVAVAQAI